MIKYIYIDIYIYIIPIHIPSIAIYMKTCSSRDQPTKNTFATASPLAALRKSTRCRLWLMPLSRAWRLKAEANSGMPGYLPGKLRVNPMGEPSELLGPPAKLVSFTMKYGGLTIKNDSSTIKKLVSPSNMAVYSLRMMISPSNKFA